MQDIFNHSGGPIAYNAEPPTPDNSTYYTFESNGKTTLFPYLGSDTYVEVGDFLIVTKRGTSYNYMYFPRAGGSVVTNLNIIRKTSNVTCAGTAIGAPNSDYSWFVEHKNDNISQQNAYQRAVAYSTELIVYERLKVGGLWTSWTANVNPSNYYLKSETYNKTEVNDLVSSVRNLEPKIVQDKSEVVAPGYLYFILVGENLYDEYLYIDGVAEKNRKF